MNGEGQPNNYSSSIKGTMYDNRAYQQDMSSALQIRLNTEPIIRQIECYLRGERETIINGANGKLSLQTKKIGVPLMNEEGLQSIMQLIETIFNAQIAQANFWDEELYEDYLCRFRKDLASNLIVNIDEYNIDINRVNPIISNIMRFIEAFMTRPYKDGERNSYAATIRTQESSTVAETSRKGMLNKLFGG